MTATDDFWERQIEFDFNWAKKTLITTGEVRAMFAVHCPNAIYPVPVIWENDEEQARFYRLIEAMCQAHKARGYSFISEAWANRVSASDNVPNVLRRMPAPSQHPERIEIVVCVAVYRTDAGDRKILSRNGEIIRDDKGKPVNLAVRGDKGLPAPGMGAIYELLPEDDPTPDEVRRALEYIAANSKEMKPN